MQKIIDSHVHIKGWGERDLVSCFDDYMAEKVETVNTCAIPLAQSNAANNILLALYKLARPKTYAHGGIELIAIPLDNMPEGIIDLSKVRPARRAPSGASRSAK